MAVDEGEGVARESVGVATGSGVRAGVWDSCLDRALHTPQAGKGDLSSAAYYASDIFSPAALCEFNFGRVCF